MIRVEVNELNRLALDLGKAGYRMTGRAIKATEVAANKIKKDAQQAISGLKHAPHYPRSITYDLKVRVNGVSAEIGPDKDRTQGALGNILEFGTVKNPPFAHLGPAYDREVPEWLKALGEEAERAVFG